MRFFANRQKRSPPPRFVKLGTRATGSSALYQGVAPSPKPLARGGAVLWDV